MGPDRNATFEEVQIGQKLWDEIEGECEVIGIDSVDKEITIKCRNFAILTFTFNGRHIYSSKRTLYWWPDDEKTSGDVKQFIKDLEPTIKKLTFPESASICGSQTLGAPPSKGLNKDNGKLRVDLVPVSAIEAIAEVLGKACAPTPDGKPPKYPERNWENGIAYSRVYANVQRHLLAWWKGRDIDPESGLHTLKHALCRLSMLVEYVERGMNNFDDRPHKPEVLHAGSNPAKENKS